MFSVPVSIVPRSRRSIGFLAALTISLGLVASLLTAPATFAAEDVVRGSTNYGRAVAVLDGSVVLWRPDYTAGLRRRGPIDVIAYGNGAQRATFAGSTYGRRVPSFTLAQKAGQTRWAATPVDHPTAALVRTEAIRIGPPGAKRVVRARVFAQCKQPGVRVRRCAPADVARFGGIVEILARTTTAEGPAVTNIRIDSNGLSYRQVLRVAESLLPVSR